MNNLIRRWWNERLARYAVKHRLCSVPHRPMFMMVEPTNLCNLKCPLCPTGNGTIRAPRGVMDYEKYLSLIDEVGPSLKLLQLWGFGEPLMHPRIWEMIERAHQYKIFTAISTNGEFVKSAEDAKRAVHSGLNRMRVSLDGASQKTLEVYRRGAKFDKIVAGIRYLEEAKKTYKSQTPQIHVQFIVMAHNQHEISSMKSLVAELGVSYRQKTVSIDAKNEEEMKTFLPDLKYSRYKQDESANGQVLPSNEFPSVCAYPWLWAHVCWDGSVVPCCKDPHRHHLLGNAFSEGGMKAVWNSNDYRKFRKNYLTKRHKLARCNRCDQPGKLPW